MNWAEFFHMGGYAAYVWSAWGLSLSVLLGLWLHAKRRRRRLIAEITRQISREQLNSNVSS